MSLTKAKIELSEADVISIITENFARRGIILEDVKIYVTEEYEDRPGGSKFPVFDKVSANIDVSHLEVSK